MKNLKITALLLLLMSFMACKKDNTKQKEVCKKPTSYADSQGQFYQLSYNTDSKLSELKTDINTYTITYQDNGNTINSSDRYYDQTFKLGPEGQILELIAVYKSSGEVTKINYQHIKTSNGYDATATTQTFRKNESVPFKTVKNLWKMSINNGNLTSLTLIDLDNNNKQLGRMTYSYNISKNLSDYPLHHHQDLIDRQPFISKNLVTRSSMTDNVTNVQIDAVFNYEFDEHDRILNSTQVAEYKGDAQTTNSTIKGTFEYKCN